MMEAGAWGIGFNAVQLKAGIGDTLFSAHRKVDADTPLPREVIDPTVGRNPIGNVEKINESLILDMAEGSNGKWYLPDGDDLARYGDAGDLLNSGITKQIHTQMTNGGEVPPSRAITPYEPPGKLALYDEGFAKLQSNPTIENLTEYVQSLGRPEPVRIIVDEYGRAIPQYQNGSYWRANVVKKDIDEAISRDGFLSGYTRYKRDGVKPEEAARSKLPPNGPINDRVIEYAGVKGSGSFPRDANVVGVHNNPFRSFNVALGTGKETLREPGSYIRLDELWFVPGQLVDTEALFLQQGLESRYPVNDEFGFDGSIPKYHIINTIRWYLKEK